jgi:7,8-dihydropterin-6-yl-methyl-4-(beta-D-ribofuranosyl)aminobenzene 5'-phosphate synthase
MLRRLFRGGAAIALGLLLLLGVCCTSEPGKAKTPLSSEGGPSRASLTVVYDNNAFDPRLRTDWGFACWVQYGETVVLFDTGSHGTVLLNNMQTLGLDPQAIDIIVLSHIHEDHTGGVEAVLGTGVRPEVYVPLTFPTQYKNRLREQVTVHEVDGPEQLLPGIYSTGKLGLNIPEQGLVFSTCQGLVVITGCAHPGIAEMVRQAKEVGQEDVYLVLGGFHLGGASASSVRQICTTFRELGVQNVAPSHCTGEQAMGIFASEFGGNYLAAGAGWGIGFCDLEDQ